MAAMIKGIVLVMAAELVSSSAWPGIAQSGERLWSTLSIDGARVGFGYHERRIDGAERVDLQVMKVDVTELHRISRVEARTEVMRSASGVPKRIRVEALSGIDRSGWRGTFNPDAGVLSVTVDGTSVVHTIAIPRTVVWPDELATALSPVWREHAPRTQFDYLDPETAAVVKATGERIDDTRVRVTFGTGGAQRTDTLSMASNGEVRQREQRFLGVSLDWEPCSLKCDASVEHPFDLMARLVVQSPFRIPYAALAGPIRYVIARVDGMTPRLPVTGEQSVVLDGARAVVTICKTCGTDETLSEADRRRYLTPNAWVQSDIAEVRIFAARHSSGISPDRTMSDLVAAVREHMNGDVDFLGYGTAREALLKRSGDCTEFSVLLAALARSRGIPARIAVGFAYSDRFSGKKDVFSPHTWVQAWTGKRWVSYDAGLGEFDATHIAVAIGDGDPLDMQAVAAPEWRIEKLGLLK